MEAIPVIAEASHALGLPLTVTLAIVVIATIVLTIIVLKDHRNRLDRLNDDMADMKTNNERAMANMKTNNEGAIDEVKSLIDKQDTAHRLDISSIKEEMSKQAASHNAELSALYKLINGVAVDVSFIKGKMTRGSK